MENYIFKVSYQISVGTKTVFNTDPNVSVEQFVNKNIPNGVEYKVEYSDKPVVPTIYFNKIK